MLKLKNIIKNKVVLGNTVFKPGEVIDYPAKDRWFEQALKEGVIEVLDKVISNKKEDKMKKKNQLRVESSDVNTVSPGDGNPKKDDEKAPKKPKLDAGKQVRLDGKPKL